MGFFGGIPTKAQTIKYISRSSVDSLMNPKIMDEGDRILSFEQKEQSIGVLFESDSPKNISYFFRNVGTSVTKIRDVRVFCGCTLVTYDKHEILPDSVGKIEVTYNPKNRIGTVDERIYIYTTDSEKYPVACLSIFGEVKDEDSWRHLPQKIGSLRLKRKMVNFMVDSLHALSTERIWCGNEGVNPLIITAKGLPEYVTFRMEPEILQSGEEGDMVITIDNEKIVRNEVYDFHFFLEGTDCDSVESVIRVKVDFL